MNFAFPFVDEGSTASFSDFLQGFSKKYNLLEYYKKYHPFTHLKG